MRFFGGKNFLQKVGELETLRARMILAIFFAFSKSKKIYIYIEKKILFKELCKFIFIFFSILGLLFFLENWRIIYVTIYILMFFVLQTFSKSSPFLHFYFFELFLFSILTFTFYFAIILLEIQSLYF